MYLHFRMLIRIYAPLLRAEIELHAEQEEKKHTNRLINYFVREHRETIETLKR